MCFRCSLRSTTLRRNFTVHRAPNVDSPECNDDRVNFASSDVSRMKRSVHSRFTIFFVLFCLIVSIFDCCTNIITSNAKDTKGTTTTIEGKFAGGSTGFSKSVRAASFYGFPKTRWKILPRKPALAINCILTLFN